MSSTWGHFVFFPFAPKTVIRSVTFLETTSVAIHCCLPELIPQSRGKTKMNEGVAACGSYRCTCRRWASFSSFPVYSKPPKSFVTYFPKKLKNPHLFYSYGRFPGRHSVAVKQFKRERRFRLLGHIPHVLVDDGAFVPLLPSEKKPPAFIKNKKKYDAFYVPAHYSFPGRILQPLTNKKTDT